MAMLLLLIIMNYSRRIIGFLRVNCIFSTYFDTGTDPPKTENFVTHPDPILPDPTRPMDGRDPCPTLIYLITVIQQFNTNTNNKISIAPKSGAKTCNQRRSVA